MHHFQRFFLPRDQSVQMHQARHVPGGDDFRAGVFVVVNAVESHHARDRLLGDGERAAEAATFVGPFQVDQLDAVQSLQQLPGFAEARRHQFTGRSQPQFPQTVATLMQTDFVRKAAFNPFDLEDINQKLAQFVGVCCHPFKVGMIVNEIVIMLANHRGATAGRTDHVIVWFEDVEKLPGDRHGGVGATGVGHRLSAAGLSRGEIDRTAVTLQKLQRRKPDVGINLIDVARNKQTNVRHAGRVFQKPGAILGL